MINEVESMVEVSNEVLNGLTNFLFIINEFSQIILNYINFIPYSPIEDGHIKELNIRIPFI